MAEEPVTADNKEQPKSETNGEITTNIDNAI